MCIFNLCLAVCSIISILDSDDSSILNIVCWSFKSKVFLFSSSNVAKLLLVRCLKFTVVNAQIIKTANKIRFNLIKKGIDEKYIKASISKIKDQESDPDFFSAIKICKRRRIGPIREESNRPLYYKKDISILARSGFSYEISKRVLEIPKD